MEATINGNGEIKEVTVDDYGRIYLGTEHKGKTVELAFEIQE